MTGDFFGYSPDIGKFVTRGDKTYTEYGYVYEDRPGVVFRSMSVDADSHENYADWTDEQRAERIAKNDREREEYEKERRTELEARSVLVAQAKKKLTEEEFDAVLRHNECEDRDL